MSNWKNVTERALKVYPNGPGKPEEVPPGGILQLANHLDYVVKTQASPGQFEKVELVERKPEEKPKAEKPPAEKSAPKVTPIGIQVVAPAPPSDDPPKE